MKHKNILISHGIQFKSALVALLLGISFTSRAQIITTIAGNGDAGYSGDGGQATAADLYNPTGIAVDNSGNIYIADLTKPCIRKVNTSGIISTFAGNTKAGYSGDGGQATAADLDGPSGVAVDASGNVYIADYVKNRIRKVNTSGIISTFAGTGTAGYSGDGGAATTAKLNYPYGIAVDASGNVYIGDYENHRVRRVNTSGIINTIAGNGYTTGIAGGYSGDGGPATAAELYSTTCIAVDASGNVYIAEEDINLIRVVNTSGIINTFAGIASGAISGANEGYSGDGGPATAAELNYPWGVTVDALGNVYIGDQYNNLIRKVNTSGIIGTFAGIAGGASSGTNIGYSGDGGPATAAELNNPEGIVVDAYGDIYIVDQGNSRIREVMVLGVLANIIANVHCNGENTGSVSATCHNGTSPYTYLWSPGGATTSTVTGLSAGTYTISITDNASATASATVTITQPTALTTGASVSNNVTCNAGSNGDAFATPSGGRSPYTYSWSNSSINNPTGSVLSAGTYTVAVTDNCGGTATASVIITQPNALTTGATILSNACNGISNGNAEANPLGGTSPYTYSWSNGITSNPTGATLSAGTYAVTVTDNCGSTATASVTIKQSTAIIPTAVVVNNVSCWGGSNGQAKVSTGGGTPPYIYFWSPNNNSTYIASGLSAGTYSVTVLDNNGCNASSSTTITQPTALKDSVSTVTYPYCGGETASATIGVSGGISPYSYQWNPNISTTATATGLNVRSYVVQVKDNNGCYNNLPFSITQPAVPVFEDSIVRSATMNVTCNGGTNGSATVGVRYGTSPYTYSWSGGGSNATVTGLSVGTYTVTVNDAGGCMATASVSIGQPGTVSATAFTGGNISCNGGSNGEAKVSANGGATPYIYSWSPVGGSAYIASGLSAGTYTVTVSDQCGASVSSSATITQPAALSDSVATISYPLCTGATGSATMGVTGGTSPYKYTWSPNISSTATATGLSVRAYAVQVKDNNGCHNSNLNFSITQPAALRDSIIHTSIVNISCSGTNNGSATVGVKYGTTPYTYTWSPAGGNSATPSGLSAGTYTVTVNDGGGCTVTASVSITQPGALTPTASETAISCNGNSNGTAKVSVSGGSSPYTYSWWSPVISSTYIASGLSAGTYSVTVEDNCGASASSSVAVTQPAILSDSVITSSVVSPPCSGGGTGSATIGVTGGTSPYNYKWSPNVSTTATATGLTVRTYVVQVKDAKGCYNNITFNVTCSTPETVTYKGTGATCCPLSDNINLYPNPNTGQFTLSGLQTGMILEMYDYTGKMISRMTTTNENMQLNILNQANGVYLIRILDKDGNLVSEKKVVKTQ